ncbi:MAG: ribosomal protein S18-alanine N-acetyltransferase [Lachnospiraceae bacterium]|nr:ribosomal protein S18-alanine N-acetyltransferase [Lachnospiraceae bacterium]MBQ9562655.1 ribosomal protein S18-alanine N-acetyltransferase [Lachnospiraceae bacterium]MBQ9593905.1 ribosomal protein S18-alanine N-acetyltransferase [Lachnospiraceae bacterium]
MTETDFLMFRPMFPGDLPRVLEIEEASFSDPWSEAGFADAMKAPGAMCTVAARGEKIEGYAIFYTVMDEAQLLNVAIAPEARGQKIGERMLVIAMQKLEMRGIRHFYLEVRESNEAARALYTKIGFGEDGIRRDFYEKPREDAVLMSFHVAED